MPLDEVSLDHALRKLVVSEAQKLVKRSLSMRLGSRSAGRSTGRSTGRGSSAAFAPEEDGLGDQGLDSLVTIDQLPLPLASIDRIVASADDRAALEVHLVGGALHLTLFLLRERDGRARRDANP